MAEIIWKLKNMELKSIVFYGMMLQHNSIIFFPLGRYMCPLSAKGSNTYVGNTSPPVE